MTRQMIPKKEWFEPEPRQGEVPKLDESLWQAWVEKGEQRDKSKFARRVKVIVILALLFAVVALLPVVSTLGANRG